MLKSLFGLVEDVARVAIAPVAIAVDATRIVTKPVADAAETLAREVSDGVRELTDFR